MKRFGLFIICLTLFQGCMSDKKETLKIDADLTSGSLYRIENFASQHLPARNVDIWLPDGYSEKEQYAVLYMHDGQMLFDASTTWNGQEWGADEALGKLMKEGKIRKTILVSTWNTEDRHAEYFPQKPFESLPAAFQDSLINLGRRSGSTPLFSKKVLSDSYLKFLVTELKPYIDRHYATLPDRANTFIAGSSMGGLISWYALCEYPEVFGGAACLSTHWPGSFAAEGNPIPAAFANYLSQNLPTPGNHKIYFDYGTETLDAMYEPLQLQVDEVMKQKGYDADSWTTLRFQGEEHSENSWKKRLHIPLEFLLSE